ITRASPTFSGLRVHGTTPVSETAALVSALQTNDPERQTLLASVLVRPLEQVITLFAKLRLPSQSSTTSTGPSRREDWVQTVVLTRSTSSRGTSRQSSSH
ncbi:hypothetical protein BaRGS_00015039, partial [Batillaria attramentaria]